MKRVRSESLTSIENNDEANLLFSEMKNLFWKKYENDFLIFKNGETHQCLVCRRKFKESKVKDLQRHYDILHSYDFGAYKGVEREETIEQFKSDLQPDNTLTKEEKAQLRVSYKICLNIAEEGRAYKDAEFVHTCMISNMQEFCIDKCELVDGINLSPKQIAHQIFELSDDVESDMRDRVKKATAYSLAFDLSQQEPRKYVAVFIRHVKNFCFTEDLLQIIPITNSTTDEDLLFILNETIDDFGLSWENLFSTSVTEAFVAYTTSGLGSLRYDRLENMVHNYAGTLNAKHNVLTGPYMFRVEDICPKITRLKDVMDNVIKIINRIRVYGSNRHEFRSFLTDVETNYCDDIPWNATDSTDVNWLKTSKLLKSFLTLTKEVKEFLETDKKRHQLDDGLWLCDCAFLSDIVEHLQNFNDSIDFGTLADFVEKISAFKLKVSLWMKQLKTKNFCHFPTMESVMMDRSMKKETINIDSFVAILEKLHTKMERRLNIGKDLQKQLEIFMSPFEVKASTVDPVYQLQLIDLQHDHYMSKMYQTCIKNSQEFYCCFSKIRYPKLYKLANQILSVFGSTATFDQVSSCVKKCRKNSPAINYMNLKSMLRIMIIEDPLSVKKVEQKVFRQWRTFNN